MLNWDSEIEVWSRCLWNLWYELNPRVRCAFGNVSIKYNSFTRKKCTFSGKLKEGVNKSIFCESWKCDTGERGNWSKILFRMLWQRRREKQKFRSFITFSRSSTYTGFSLCDTFWPKILHHLTHFQDSFVFILSFLFPYTRCRQISDLMQWILPEFYALSQI